MTRLDKLAEMARGHYIAVTAKTLGSQGIDILRDFLPVLQSIHRSVDYESISVALTVCFALNGNATPLDYERAYRVADVSHLALYNSGALLVEAKTDGTFYVWKEQSDVEAIHAGRVIYHYEPGKGEKFWIDGVEGEVPSSVAFTRIFGISRFEDLADCLNHYAIHLARSSECNILAALWREDGRVMWKAGPETEMRKSLYQHLKSSLREGNPDITQETRVDDRNPVDIQVKWENSNRIALIEIKWIGASGVLGDKPRITKRWPESRALDGLRQLAEYLDLTRARAGAYDRRGFLFVYDARRARVTADTLVLSRRDGLKYQDAHIRFQADLLSRSDMAAPIRCFCEPNFATGASPSRK
ncbi:hypothetical protein [Nonomuraea candida]|uniref:hypothetical protein n=1 Tax=Nonomuraea candida TaxID=359159 RepID=UPI0012FA1C26|nr:hypothetical protein [Nonomuraea candida]